MKITTRRNVFETNSSSMHTLVITKNNENFSQEEIKDTCWFNKDGYLDLRYNDLYFGRSPFDCLGTVREKVQYAIAAICSYSLREDMEEKFKFIESTFKEIYPDCKGILLPEECDYDREGNAIKHTCYGHVDEDILTPFLKNNNISLKDFLQNKRYVVIVDGDEYCIYGNMIKAGLINTENIEKEYPDYDW